MPTAVVTGAGSGLGRAIALELGRRGYLVHATDIDGLQLRLLDLFPRLTVRLLPFATADARRRQRRYAKKIAAGDWP